MINRFLNTKVAFVGLGLCVVSLGCDPSRVDVRSQSIGVDAFSAMDMSVAETGGVTVSPLPSCEQTTDCPSGSDCHSVAKVCTECVATVYRCGAEGEREICEAPVVLGPGQVSGGMWRSAPCDEGLTCALEDAEARCRERICEPEARDCLEDGRIERCNAYGTELSVEHCNPGFACYSGVCDLVRHNVLLLFDTSGSMNDYLAYEGNPVQCEDSDAPCLEPFPVCDDPADPLTKMTLAKEAFSEILLEVIGGFSQFALQRFPQREYTFGDGDCLSGWYRSASTMSGDVDAMLAGDWFDDAVHEAVVVPFPFRRDRDNTEAIRRWLDSIESLAPTSTPCVDARDCPEGGSCRATTSGDRCFRHDNPELRAGGETPLGRSLFYAGEYFRRSVVLEGKGCEGSHDCRVAGHVCAEEGVCRDPYRDCKDNFVLVFTDGYETAAEPGTFFHPEVQAQRMAFGLGCETEADCRGEAQCENGLCVAPDQTFAQVSDLGIDPSWRGLSAADGSALRVRVNVVSLHKETGGSSVPGQRIADAGDGAHLDVHADAPEVLVDKLREVMKIQFKCFPDDLSVSDP